MIRSVALPGTGLEASCLGFGCASLGSRISRHAGFAALMRAHEAGVTWFDVAPAYGAGEAESILGRFLWGRRDRVRVLTKVGLAPPHRSPLLRAAFAATRPLGPLLRGLRKSARRVKATRNRVLAITPDLIESSIAHSLRNLRTEAVDVYALHDPDPRLVADESVIRALEAVVRRGQARFIGVAGDLDACLAGTANGLPYTVFQTALRPLAGDAERIADAAKRAVTIIGHSVLGVGGAKEALIERLRGDSQRLTALREAGYAANDVDAAIGDLLIDAALAGNPAGVTLVSMFQPAHLARNLARAENSPRREALELLRRLSSA
jgi:aryl-alcohol dehydrogenase-like predicted oxidoreductase